MFCSGEMSIRIVLGFGFMVVYFARGSTIPPLGKEGKDFFYNAAVGYTQSCAEFCDLPTDYHISCRDWCYDYIPKNRTDEASLQQGQAPAENNLDTPTNNTDYIPFVVTGLVILFLVVTGLILYKCFSQRLQTVLRRLREILCEQLTNARPEEGVHQPSEQAMEPFLQQSGHNICVGQGSQPVESCLQAANTS